MTLLRLTSKLVGNFPTEKAYITSIKTRLKTSFFLFIKRTKTHLQQGIIKKKSGGDTPGPPLREGVTPSRTHPQHGQRPCAAATRPIVRGKISQSHLSPPSFKVLEPPLVVSLFLAVPIGRTLAHDNSMCRVIRRQGHA